MIVFFIILRGSLDWFWSAGGERERLRGWRREDGGSFGSIRRSRSAVRAERFVRSRDRDRVRVGSMKGGTWNRKLELHVIVTEIGERKETEDYRSTSLICCMA
ncbi:hypothetical protein OPV22_018225 [Ensete ventricosum]|uniref:Uncharacterized protein n=1 Tax=Ensete ventricosum TaxID=4639 RepID=A0AAV8PG45_ENSVE|nr:hypothetical protein OPV22_018225 [Ensete ventricosum]